MSLICRKLQKICMLLQLEMYPIILQNYSRKERLEKKGINLKLYDELDIEMKYSPIDLSANLNCRAVTLKYKRNYYLWLENMNFTTTSGGLVRFKVLNKNNSALIFAG